MRNRTKVILILLVVLTAGSSVFGYSRRRGGSGFGNRSEQFSRGGGEGGFGGRGEFGPGEFGGRGRGGRVQRQGRGPGLKILRYLHAFSLTEQQRGDIRDIIEESREKMQGGREGFREAMQLLDKAVMNAADAETIKAAAEKVKLAMIEEASIKVSIVDSIRNLLTEEQLAELDEIIEESKNERGQFRQSGRRGMGRQRDEQDCYKEYGRGSRRQGGGDFRRGRRRFYR